MSLEKLLSSYPRVQTPDEFAGVCAAENEYRGPDGPFKPCLVGAVDCPPFHGTIAWVNPCTLGDALKDHRRAITEYGVNYNPAYGMAYTCARILVADPDCITLPAGEDPQLYHPGERGEPWFPGGDEDLKAWSDPAVEMGPAWNLGVQVKRQLGFARALLPLPARQPSSLAEVRAQWKQRHLWVDGLFAVDPQIELCVTPIAEAARQNALKAATMQVEDRPNVEVICEPIFTAHLVAGCLRSGPGGSPIVTVAMAKQLQYGTAECLLVFQSMAARPEGDDNPYRFQPIPKPVLPAAPGGAAEDDVGA